MSDYYTEAWKRDYSLRVLRPSRAIELHPATTHALINGIPEREAYFVYNFWQAMNLRLKQLDAEAFIAWALVNALLP